MRTRLSILASLAVLICLLAGNGAAEQVIKSFPSPYTSYAYGLAWDGSNLWVGDDGGGYVAKIDTSDGSVITEIIGAPQSNHGLAWDGTHLWVSGDYHTDYIYRIAPNGDRVDSIINPCGDYSGGMTWDGKYLWVTRYYPNTQPNLFKVDVPVGTVLDTIPSQGLQPQGMAWDGTYIWNVQDDNDDDPERVWQLDAATGDTLMSFPVPDTGSASGESPRGLAWDGQYLWLVSKGPATNNKYIYKIDPFGGGVPDIQLTASEHDYGHVLIGSPEDWSLGVYNDGSADLIVTGVTSSNPRFTWAATFPETIPPAQTFYFAITFSPTVWGPQTGILTVYSNDALGDTPTVDLSGWGVWPDAEIGPLPASHNYGSIRAGADKRWLVTVQNQGAQPLILYSADTGTPYFGVREASFPVVIDSTMSFDLDIWFGPDDAVSYVDTMVISTNDASEPAIQIALSGQGDGSPYGRGSVLWSYQVTGGYSQEITSIRSIPDVNGDGMDDVVATAEDYHTYCFNGNGSGYADVLWSFDTSTDPMRTGSVWQDFGMITIPDLDGDGIYDVVIGTAGGSRSIFAISGADGDTIWDYDSHEYGGGGWIDEVAPIGDIDGDGITDVLAAAEDDGSDTGPKRAYCFSGANGIKIWQTILGASVFCVRAIDDFNGDGLDEVAAGTTQGRVYLLNGANGGLLDVYEAGATVWTVAAIEDISGDGENDIVVGDHDGYVHAVDSDSLKLVWPNPTSVGNIITEVHVIGDQNSDGVGEITVAGVMSNYLLLDGSDGQYIWSRSSGQMAFATSGTPDVNGDGFEDVIGGSGFTYNRAAMMDGQTGDTLWTFPTLGPVETVSYLASIDGDAVPEVLVGTRDGEVYCLAGGGGTAGVSISGSDGHTGPIRLANNPNPFRDATTLRYYLAGGARVSLEIFDVGGRRVRTLVDGRRAAGEHFASWDGCDQEGREAAAGVYFARLRAGDDSITGKLLLLK
ncbi:MAG: choice-of-anchor D domain-containing protein [bacterium]